MYYGVATVRSGGMSVKVYKCDRCGNFYDNNTEIKTKGAVHGGYVQGIATFNRTIIDEYFDLCDDCMKEFFNFMERKQTPKEHDGCKGCEYMKKGEDELPCVICSNRYRNRWKSKESESDER